MATLLGIVVVVLVVAGLLGLHRYAGGLDARPPVRTREARPGSAPVDAP